MTTLKAVLLVGALLAAAGLLAVGCQEQPKPPTPPPKTPAAAPETGPAAEPVAAPAAAPAAEAEIAQKTCPVMGGAIDPTQYVDYQGRRIYFCCPSCVETFKKDPEKYLAKVDEQLKGAGAATEPAKP